MSITLVLMSVAAASLYTMLSGSYSDARLAKAAAGSKAEQRIHHT